MEKVIFSVHQVISSSINFSFLKSDIAASFCYHFFVQSIQISIYLLGLQSCRTPSLFEFLVIETVVSLAQKVSGESNCNSIIFPSVDNWLREKQGKEQRLLKGHEKVLYFSSIIISKEKTQYQRLVLQEIDNTQLCSANYATSFVNPRGLSISSKRHEFSETLIMLSVL